jgi:hypothetical protein
MIALSKLHKDLMMDFDARQQQALAILDRTGMHRSSYAPPLLQVLWRMGVQVRPPHFMGFWRAAALTGGWFGAAWGLVMWLMLWSRQQMDGRMALAGACGAGLCFGLSMALYYAHGKKKYQLPSWESLSGH